MERNHFLDCVRTLAVFLVLAVHAHLLVGGGIGVSIFFCLSGYLIATILLHIDPSPAGRWTLLWSALVGIGLAWFAKFYVGGGHQGLYGQIYPHDLYPLLPTIVYLDKLMIG